MNYKNITAIAAALLLASAANAEWHFGIGGGGGLVDYDGDVQFKGAKFDVDFDNSDIESAFGLGGYASNGTWVIAGSGRSIEFENKTSLNNGAGKSKNNFTDTGAEVSVGYVVYKEGNVSITPYLGLRYTKQQWTFKCLASRPKADENWTDALLGVKLDYRFADAWTWNNIAEYAGGDSEGCYTVKTGVTWKFAKNWSTGAYVGYAHDEFESGSYKYDTDITSAGLTIMFHW